MEFLFHTIVHFGGVPVYYNVFRGTDHYFCQVLENPGKVEKAEDFSLKEVDGKWRCSIEIKEREVEVLVEEVQARSFLGF